MEFLVPKIWIGISLAMIAAGTAGLVFVTGELRESSMAWEAEES